MNTARRETDWPLWCGLGFGIMCCLAPLASVQHLPFVDLPGHMGFVGAQVHEAEPAARISRYYTIDVRLIPTVLYEALAYIAYPYIAIETFTRLFIAAFAILGLPLAMVYALRVFGRDQRLALLVLPLLYHRCLWYGFIDYCSALPFLILALALLTRSLQAFSWPRCLALALASVATVAGHAFVAMVLFGLAALLVLAHGDRAMRERRQFSSVQMQSSKAALGLLPAGLYLASWFMQGVKESDGNKSLLGDVLQARHSLVKSASLFYEWSLGSLKGWQSDAPILVLVANLVLVGVWAARHRAGNDDMPKEHRWPLMLLLVTTLVFLLLPMRILSPLDWWAVSVRLVVPIWLFLILTLPRARTRLPIQLFLPVLAATLFQGVVLTRDFVRFERQDMAHFDQAIAAIPPGARLLGLWPVIPELQRYRDEPLRHVANYYVVRQGGVARTSLVGNSRQNWVHPKAELPSPQQSHLRSFRWKDHGGYYDYFLLRDPVEGRDDLPGGLHDAPAGELSLVGRFGLWRLWKRLEDTTGKKGGAAGFMPAGQNPQSG